MRSSPLKFSSLHLCSSKTSEFFPSKLLAKPSMLYSHSKVRPPSNIAVDSARVLDWNGESAVRTVCLFLVFRLL